MTLALQTLSVTPHVKVNAEPFTESHKNNVVTLALKQVLDQMPEAVEVAARLIERLYMHQSEHARLRSLERDFGDFDFSRSDSALREILRRKTKAVDARIFPRLFAICIRDGVDPIEAGGLQGLMSIVIAMASERNRIAGLNRITQAVTK